ncbi:MAG: SDR family NAD(P)-dependent oxidoreductase [Alphaproteobacteria bacterium]|nr:SDR family NAD(P)-dependent oxidoreductase [Alphaproteobacteria bacterium]MBF0130773.1 SDR family NAD(P)-dependent oxidoreductase [Alphaproteobacteria bacterium]
MSKPSYRLAGRVALITGASRGVGKAVALRYAREGAQIIAVARTLGALEELDDEIRSIEGASPAVLVPEDLADHDKIDQMGLAVFNRFGKLDILVGNAAILGTLSPMGHIKPDEWERVMAVNVTANYRLIRSFDPLLRQSDAGRAIFVTSGVASGVFPYWGAYAASKAALEMMVKVYAGEVTKTNLKVNLLDPGVVRTRMRAEAFPGEDPAKVPPAETVTHVFVDLALPSCPVHGSVTRAYAPS